MYLLDRDFRIVDWNNAFRLAFDGTMEGRRGVSVLEWTYFLDNYEEVLDHGVAAFSDPDNFPNVDVESIKFTSSRYGIFDAVKREYKFCDDNGTDILGWLIILELAFRESGERSNFQLDLIRVVSLDDMWTEYSISYDRVLPNTTAYGELLDEMLGENGGLNQVPENSRVLDLGAGTGNISARLARQDRGMIIVAMDNNSAMPDMLRAKCAIYLREDDKQPGVIPIKQDITKLFGLKDDYFDTAILNNVLYSLSEPLACLKEVHRVLQPGGDIRLSGPKKDTDLNVLFDRIRADLEERGLFSKLERHYEHVRMMNQLRLRPLLHRWTVDDVANILMDAGFSEITYKTDQAYAGQAMILGARK